MAWSSFVIGRDVHLVPTDERDKHSAEDCACNPKIYRSTDSGSLVKHESEDGREGLEYALRVLNHAEKDNIR